MATFTQSLDQPFPDECSGGAVTIGNFDGVHLGHQSLLAETARQAKIASGPSVAITFEPHPQQLLRPADFQPLLTTFGQRARLIQEYGVDHVLILRISEAFLRLSASEFFERLVYAGLKARAIVEGFNFAFGRRREGTTDMLRALSAEAGIALSLVKACEQGGQPVSTSRVRAELLAGNVSGARQLLGRCYSLSGTVAVGQKRGRTLGFPTANLDNIATLIPADGVYAGRVSREGRIWPAAVNIGPNPTFSEHDRKIEAHLIGFQGELYNDTLSVDFHERIRATKTFSGAAELIHQLQTDIQQTLQSLAANLP
jgi:riboflavin kinase/FMN adenylyltransferase